MAAIYTFTFDSSGDADNGDFIYTADGQDGLGYSSTYSSWVWSESATFSYGTTESGQGGNPDGYVYTRATATPGAGGSFEMEYSGTLDPTTHDWSVKFYEDRYWGTNLSSDGSVQFHAWDGTQWVNELTVTGSMPAATWTPHTIDLSGYSNTDLTFRIVVITGSDLLYAYYQTSIDSITVTGVPSSIHILSADDGEFLTTEAGIDVAGGYFEAAQGAGKVELGDSDTYATATKVTQSVNTWADTLVNINIVLGGLAQGTLYLYVTNESGETSEALAVIVQDPPTVFNYNFDTSAIADNGDFFFDGPLGDGISTSSGYWGWSDAGTPSSGRGPSTGQGGNPDGYVFTECSSTSNGATWTMEYDTDLDASARSYTVKFYENRSWRNDPTDGTVFIEVWDGSQWVEEDSWDGNTDAWVQQVVDLSAYTNSDMRFRLGMTSGSQENFSYYDTGFDTVEVSSVSRFGLASAGDGDLLPTDTGVIATGSDLGTVEGLLELADSATYAGATKVPQTVNSWSETVINFDVVLGGLTQGQLYLYATHDNNAVTDALPVFVRNPTAEILTSDKAYYLDGDTGAVITGTTFGSTKGTSKLYIANNANGTGLSELTTTSWGDTSITFNIDSNGGRGSFWLYVVLNEGGVASETVSNAFPASVWPTPDSYYEQEFDTSGDASNSDFNFASPVLTGITTENRSWHWEDGETTSLTTGPPHGEGGDPDGYVYVESSGGSYGDIHTAEYDAVLNGETHQWVVHFFEYRDFRADAEGLVEFQAYDGSAWVTVDSWEGDNNNWDEHQIDLGSYTNTDLKFRIKFTAGQSVSTSGWDFGLDHFTVRGYLRVANVDADAELTHTHSMTAGASKIAYIDASATLESNHTFTGVGVIPHKITGAVSMVHGHEIYVRRYKDTSATLDHSHTIAGTSTGGTPIAPDQDIQFDIADDPLANIDTPVSDGYAEKSWSLSYSVEKGTTACSVSGGLNSYPINSKVINGCPEGTVSVSLGQLELTQAYKLGDAQLELVQEYDYCYDAISEYKTLDQTYTLRVAVAELVQEYSIESSQIGGNLVEFSMDQSYLIFSNAWIEEFNDIINEFREDFGLVSLVVWDGFGPDVCQVHASDMAKTNYLGHDSPEFTEGYETVESRGTILQAVNGNTTFTENSLVHYVSEPTVQEGLALPGYWSFPTPQQAFQIFYDSPPHKLNILFDHPLGSNPVMMIGMEFTQTEGVHTDFDGWTQTLYLNQNFFNYAIPEDKLMAQIELHQEWGLTSAPIWYFDQVYDLDAKISVSSQHEALYSIRISTQHEANYGCRVSAQHEAPIHYTVHARHEATYTETQGVCTQHEAGYDLTRPRILTQHESIYSIRLSTQFKSLYDDLVNVSSQHELKYGNMVNVSSQHTGLYSDMRFINKVHEALYSINHTVVQQHECAYQASHTVRTQHEGLWDLSLLTRVITTHEAYWVLIDGLTQSSSGMSNTAIINGTEVDLIEVLISAEESDPLWSCRMILKDFTHAGLFVEGAQYTINMGGDVYLFQYDSKRISRGAPDDAVIVVEGLSPAMVLQSPRASQIDRSYDTPVLAQDIIEDILGQSVDWDFPSWYIPANTIVAEGAIPLDLAVSILNKVGGLIESNIDGSLAVRRKYKVATNLYDMASSDQIYSDATDNLSVSDQYEAREGWNKYRVLSADTEYGDSLEYVSDEDSKTQGILRAYPAPWRDTIDIATTSSAGVFVGPRTWVVRDEEDLVEFTEGEGSLQYPAESITSIEWYSEPLGAILHTQYTKELSTGVSVNFGYGLAKVIYKTKSMTCDTSGVSDTNAQFVVEEIEE